MKLLPKIKDIAVRLKWAILNQKPPETRAELLARAGLDYYLGNTGIILSTDGNFRVGVKSAIDNRYGDCVSIEVMFENEPGLWHCSHFSPARARLIANALNARADYLEANDPGMRCIDKYEGVTKWPS